MTNSTEKTIPYRPSATDLENLRRLRRRTHLFWSDRDDVEEEKAFDKNGTQDSNSNRLMQKSEKDIS